MPRQILNIRDTGTAFAASLVETEIKGIDGYLDKLLLSFKADITAGQTVALATALQTIQNLVIRKDGDPIIDIRGDDLLAMVVNLFDNWPSVIEGAAGEDDKILGIPVPIWLPRAQWNKNVTYELGFAAITNVNTPTVSLKGSVLQTPKTSSHLEYKTIAFGNGSNSGINVFDNEKDIPVPNGKELVGLGIRATTIPTATADTSTVRKIQLLANNVLTIETDWDVQGADSRAPAHRETAILKTAVNNWRFIDLMDGPFPQGKATLKFSSQAADAVRLLPIFKSVT